MEKEGEQNTKEKEKAEIKFRYPEYITSILTEEERTQLNNEVGAYFKRLLNRTIDKKTESENENKPQDGQQEDTDDQVSQTNRDKSKRRRKTRGKTNKKPEKSRFTQEIDEFGKIVHCADIDIIFPRELTQEKTGKQVGTKEKDKGKNLINNKQGEDTKKQKVESNNSEDSTKTKPKTEKITQKKNDQTTEVKSNIDNEDKQKEKRNIRIPPLIINVEQNAQLNWAKVNRIVAETNTEIREAKIIRSGDYRLVPNDSNSHRRLTKELDNQGIRYHTYQLPEDKKLKIVIRGVDPNGDNNEFLMELQERGYPALAVNKITSVRNGTRRNTPLIAVELEKTQEGKNIYNLTNLMGLRVTVETLKRRSGPGQCFRCQRFGHAANCCRLQHRCVSCGENHPSNVCPADKKTTPPKCANCTQAHPANYRGCIKYPKPEDKIRRDLPKDTEPRARRIENIREGTTYAQAARNTETNQDQDNTLLLNTIITLLKKLMNNSPGSLITILNSLNTA